MPNTILKYAIPKQSRSKYGTAGNSTSNFRAGATSVINTGASISEEYVTILDTLVNNPEIIAWVLRVKDYIDYNSENGQVEITGDLDTSGEITATGEITAYNT